MIDNAIIEFKKYISNYDLNNSDIKSKYNHTFRVTDYAKLIVKSITDDEKLINTVLISAILHDIGRFEQFKEYDTYVDFKSFDHGDKGAEILKNNNYISKYVNDDYLKDVIIHVVKNHNKKELVITGDYFKDTVLKVVRDADQTDILFEQNNEIKNLNYKLNDNFVDSILACELCNTRLCKEYDDDLMVYLAFVFDVNYKETLRLIKNKGIIEYKLKILSDNVDDDRITLIKDKIINYINNKIGDDIKC